MSAHPDVDDWLAERIAHYERHHLDGARPNNCADALPDVLNDCAFVRIRSIAAFWRTDSVPYVSCATNLAVAAHTYRNGFMFVLSGTPRDVKVFVAVDSPDVGRALLQSAYPGLRVDDVSHQRLGDALRPLLKYNGRASGIPSRRNFANRYGEGRDKDGDEASHLERLIRGMRDATWTYVVVARPHTQSTSYSVTSPLVIERRNLLESMVEVTPYLRTSVQQTAQEGYARTTRQNLSVSQVSSIEITNRHAQYLLELLEREGERLDQSLALGQWAVDVYFGATEEAAAKRLAALLSSILSGAESKPDRVRATLSDGAIGEQDYTTYLSSQELGFLTDLPREEVPGYAVTDFAPFDVDIAGRVDDLDNGLRLGDILRDGTPSGNLFEMPVDDLTKHGLIVGVTGSGKTTTLRSLLSSVEMARGERNASFLVIEPAKTEYRALLGDVIGSTAYGPLPHLRVYTLGNDNVAPFRLNPFEFETPDNYAGPSLLLNHIDLLKAVFNAAFILYAPMPYILDVALHRIYEDKGWSLTSGRNNLLTPEDWSDRHTYPIFPTLGDLHGMVQRVMQELNYDKEIEQNVIAGLQARINSLRIGSKGLMLDIPRGIEMRELLTRPTVLELENIGNDAEKTFVMGLILSRLYEYRRIQAARGKIPEGLQHIVVIEEAHRLLQRTSTDVDVESANPRAQGVETFVNLLSEIRRYGQGVLIAEQIPSKLAPDAIKNANLKVIHRLLAEDDRTTLAGTMNMSEAQSCFLTTLLPGQAAVFAEGNDHPYLVKMHNVLEGQGLSESSDTDIWSIARTYVVLDRYLMTPDLDAWDIQPQGAQGAGKELYQDVMAFNSRAETSTLWTRIILQTLYARSALNDALNKMKWAFYRDHPEYAEDADALRLVVVLGVATAIYSRAADYRWRYSISDALRIDLTRGLLRTLDGQVDPTTSFDAFVARYQTATERAYGPYPGCMACPARCRYRVDVRYMLSPEDRTNLDKSFNNPNESYKDTAQWWKEEVVSQWVGVPEQADALGPISYCSAVVAAADLGVNERKQATISSTLAPFLIPSSTTSQ